MKIVRIKRTEPRLLVSDFGPIRSADIHFGDLTVLVGPQATGKSIFLQLLKLLVDARHVKYEFKRAGIDWGDKFHEFMDVYFGEGMRSLWTKEAANGQRHKSQTKVRFREASVALPEFIQDTKGAKGESMFFVPAQRVLTLREGWPQAFNYYASGVPFAVREFSEKLRLLMNDFGTEGDLFPVPRRLKEEFREMVQQHIFPGFKLRVDTERAQKRLVLSANGSSLPFMVWSAGQREFVPLLLGLYYLLTPAGASKRKGVDWVVIEELEMGLHPRAINVVLLMLFELVTRGYRVCLSTHSAQVLDAVWALKNLKSNNAPAETLLKIFDAPATPSMAKFASQILKKTTRVYYFDRVSGRTKDISNLDSWSEDEAEAGWGGLAEFSGRANEVVARAVANGKSEVAQ